MTKREFLTAVSNGEMTDELKEFATAEIKKMDDSAAACRKAFQGSDGERSAG